MVRSKISVEKKNVYKNQLSEVIASKKIKKYAIEGNLQVAISYVKIKKFEVFVYGAGLDICTFVKFLKDEGINVTKIIDASVEKQSTRVMGVEVISPEVFCNENRKNIFVFVYTCYTDSFREMQIMKVLQKAGVEDFFGIGGG